MTSQVSMYSAMYSAYRPVEKNLLAYLGRIRPKRQFDHAGGVWRELPRKRMRLRRIALLMATAAACYWMFLGHHLAPVPVTLSTAVAKDVPVYLEASAVVQANQTVTVHTQVDGQLSEIVFKEGQDVKAGDVLAKIDPHTYQTQYDEAVANKTQDEAMLLKAKNDLAKLKSSLNAKNAAHKHTDAKQTAKIMDEKRSEVRQFEATVQSDQVVIDTLKMQLSRSVIVSPIDGRTGIRQVDAGNMVHASDANGLVVITQVEPVAVVFDLPEKSLRPIGDRLSKGDKISALAMDGDNQHVLDEGKLELVDNQVDAATGMIHLKALFPNHKRLLWPGASVPVRLLVSSLKGAIVVPVSAIHTPAPTKAGEAPSDSGPFVYVYKASSNTIEMRPVKVAMKEDGNAVIQEGLHAGDKVVTGSVSPVVDGNPVILQDKLSKPAGQL